MNLQNINEENIEAFLNQHSIVILDFYADWCGPCKQFAPVFENVSKMYLDIGFGKVNTEKALILSEDFGIRSIPTLVVLKERTIIYEQAGALLEFQLKSLLDEAIKVDLSKLETHEDQELNIQDNSFFEKSIKDDKND